MCAFGLVADHSGHHDIVTDTTAYLKDFVCAGVAMVASELQNVSWKGWVLLAMIIVPATSAAFFIGKTLDNIEHVEQIMQAELSKRDLKLDYVYAEATSGVRTLTAEDGKEYNSRLTRVERLVDKVDYKLDTIIGLIEEHKQSTHLTGDEHHATR